MHKGGMTAAKAEQGQRSRVVGIGGCGTKIIQYMVGRLPPELDLFSLDQASDDEASYGAAPLQFYQYKQPALEPMLVGDKHIAYKDLLGSTAPLYIVAGLGGHTGSHETVALAEAAHAKSVQVICLATLPFSFEGRRCAAAKVSLSGLAPYVAACVTFHNDQLRRKLGGQTKLETAFSTQSEWVMQALLAVHWLYGQDQLETLLAKLGADRSIEVGDGRSLNGELGLTRAVDAPDKGLFQ